MNSILSLHHATGGEYLICDKKCSNFNAGGFFKCLNSSPVLSSQKEAHLFAAPWSPGAFTCADNR